MNTPKNSAQRPSQKRKHYSSNDPAFDEIFICTTCFSLTSKGANTQRCQCEPYQHIPGLDAPSGYHLCYICAVRVAGGTSRWSHEACSICLDANKSLASQNICLPLGRHSIMNGLAIPVKVSKERLEELAGQMVGFISVMTFTSELAKKQSILMYQSESRWINVPFIPVQLWEQKFTSSNETEFEKSKSRILEIVSYLTHQ